MATSFVNAVELRDPLMGFRFVVTFLGGFFIAHPFDLRFQEVSGLGVSVETSQIDSLGQGTSSRKLPGKTNYQNLVLKRGMPRKSSLRREVIAGLTGAQKISRTILISILNESGRPYNNWLLKEAYPVNWSLSGLDANSGEVIIESLELTYSSFRAFTL